MNQKARCLITHYSAVLSALALCGCTTMNITEGALLHPGRAAAISVDAAIAAAPGYVREDHEILTPDGVKLSAVLFRKAGSRLTVAPAQLGELK